MNNGYDVKIKKLTDNAKTPKYMTDGAAGFDLYASYFIHNGNKDDKVTLYEGDHVVVGTGISMEIPEDNYVAIVPRSGLACKQGVTVVNTPGTIDSDYRGEIFVTLINLYDKPVTLSVGDRISQGILQSYNHIDNFIEVDSLEDTDRSSGGFGSTGTN